MADLESLRQQVNKLDQIPAIKRLLEPDGVRIETIPIAGGILGMFKVYEKDARLARINFFEDQLAIGFIVSEERKPEIPDNQLLKLHLGSGGHLPILTPGTFGHYVKFLNQISGYIIEDAEERAYEASGLTSISVERTADTIEKIQRILKENGNFLREKSVQRIGLGKNSNTLKFYGPEDKPISIPIWYIKRAKLIEEVVEEKIEDVMEIAGVVLPIPGETKRGHYRRLRKLELESKCKLASGWPGQVRLWYRLGFGNPIPTKDPQAKISAHDLVRFLLLGKSNLKPGPLAPYTSLPVPDLQWSTLDVVTNKINPMTGMRNVAPILKPIDVLDKKDSQKTLPLVGVAAFRIISDASSLVEVIEKNESLTRDLARITGTPSAKIALVTPDLFSKWKQNGTPFSSVTELDNAIHLLPPKKRMRYGLSGRRDSIFYWEPSVKPGIGGGVRLLEINMSNGDDSHLLIPIDLGLHFGDELLGFKDLGKRSPTAEQLMQDFRTGIMPPIPGLWSEDVIKVVFNRMQSASHEDWLWKFINEEMNYINSPASQKSLVPFASLSHPHADHHKLLSLIRGDVPVVLDTSTMAILTALSEKAKLWQSRFLRVTHFSKSEKPYPSNERMFMPIHELGVPKPMMMGLTLTQWNMPHSIPSVARYFDFGSTSLFDTGDWKENEKGEAMATFEAASKVDPEYVAFEMTGMDRVSDKPEDETQVRDSLKKIVKEAPDKPIVLVMPANNLERIWRVIHEVAGERMVAMEEGFAHIQRTTSHFKILYPNSPGLNFAPDEPFNNRVTLWEKHQSVQSRALKDLIAYLNEDCGVETLTPLTLSKTKNPIILFSPFTKLNQLDGIDLPNLHIVYCASFPYDSEARRFLKANRDFLSLMTGESTLVSQFDIRELVGYGYRGTKLVTYKDGPLHVSGHATKSQIVEAIRILQDGRRGKEPLTIISYHLLHAEKAAKYIQERLGKEKIKFVARKARMNLVNPLENGVGKMGFRLRMR